MKSYLPGRWFTRFETGGIYYLPPGEYEEGQEIDYSQCIRVPLTVIDSLIKFLDSEGYLKPRLDDRLRNEDLKITHRLLNLLEQKLPNGVHS